MPSLPPRGHRLRGLNPFEENVRASLFEFAATRVPHLRRTEERGGIMLAIRVELRARDADAQGGRLERVDPCLEVAAAC